MDYAIILCFDQSTEAYFNNIIASIAGSGVSGYMIDHKIPPHITVAFFSTEKIGKIIGKLDKSLPRMKADAVTWASLGTFVPRVLFAAPVMSQYLLNACIEINRLIAPLSTLGSEGHYYLPYQWVPHTALAVQLDSDGLKKAFDIASGQFTAVSGRSNRLLLAECNPYKVVKTWDLK